VLQALGRRLRKFRAASYSAARELVQNATGLEIGGPSPIFASGGLLPVYLLAAKIDNCNFADHTIFDNHAVQRAVGAGNGVAAGGNRAFGAGKTPGFEFIAEGNALGMIAEGSYDFVLSSHMLEHSANPLKALREWRRILKPVGGLILVMPHRDGTFDHRRPVTSLEHLLQDFNRDVGEDDPTHAAEVIALHDLSRDFGVTDVGAFHERVRQNAVVRGVHHHVFDTRRVMDIVTWAGFDLVTVEALLPYHIVVVARCAAGPTGAARAPDGFSKALQQSPFPSDRA
jgi:SAM-dependent methyltransferase